MAAMAIANIATNVRNQARMLKMGILEPIESLARVGLDPKGKGGGKGGNAEERHNLVLKKNISCCAFEWCIDVFSLSALCFLFALFSLPFLALFAPSSTAKRDGETERYCLLAIANIAVSSENHKEIINRCLDTLIGFSKSSDVRCRQFSMFALGNLASDPQNLDVVMQGGCLKPIVSFAFPGDHNVQVRLYCTCWWYSLCNFQYRSYYAHTCSYNFDCCIRTCIFLFLF